MLKNLFSISLFAFLVSQTSSGTAQALPTATGHGSVQVGGGWTLANPDYGQKKIQGITGFADFDFSTHIGVEADVHYIALITPDDLAENSYLIGPRFLLRHRQYNLYAKALLGVGDLVIQNPNDNIGRQAGTNFAYAAGGGLDINFPKHIVLRAIDIEYQHWSYLTGLTPFVGTVGVAYRFH